MPKRKRVESTERKEENLDEKEKLAEAGQQRQEAPEDTVVHVTELWRRRERAERRESENNRAKHKRLEIGEKNPRRGSRAERGGGKKALHAIKHQLRSRKQGNGV